MQAYQQLLTALDFINFPASFPGVPFGDNLYAAQARYIRQWLRIHRQKGELLNVILFAATALEQVAAFEFDHAEINMRKAAERIQANRDQLRLIGAS